MGNTGGENFFASLFKRKNDENIETSESDLIRKTSDSEKVESEKIKNDIKNNSDKILALAYAKKSALRNLCSVYVSDKSFNPFSYVIENIDENNTFFEKIYSEMIIFSHSLQTEAQKLLIKIDEEESLREAKFGKREIENIDTDFLANPQKLDTSMNLSALGGIDDFDEVDRMIREFDAEYADEVENKEEVPNDKKEVSLEPIEPEIKIKVAEDELFAWIFIFPPRNGGKDISEASIKNFLAEKNIKFGINNDNIKVIADNKLYLYVIEISRGVFPINGKDGSLICNFSMDNKKTVQIQEDENGNLNYKDLGLIHDIHKDDVICEIIPPAKAVDGINVYGEPAKGTNGKSVHIPRGKNTKITEDGLKLIATMDGQITFDNDAFNVNKLLTINGDVDSSVGNIDFAGDIMIVGSIREGFRVCADGSITIKGSIECANIISGGNIKIEMGMNGGGRGKIEAKGNIKAKFFESCTVRAGGKIFAETIRYAEVYCDDSVSVMENKGIVIGGKIVAANLISVRVVGSNTNNSIVTEMILGCTPKMIDQRNAFVAKLDEINQGIEKINKNIDYIENLPADIKAGRSALLEQLKMQVPLRQMQKAKLSKMIQKIEQQMSDVDRCSIRCDQVYPILNVQIGSQVRVVRKELNRVKISCKNGEITFDKY